MGRRRNDGPGSSNTVTLHFMEPHQAPVIGWRGHRYSSTRDYSYRPASVMREEARRSLRIKRALHRGESLEVAEHREDNRPEYALHREHGIQPGREPQATKRSARATSRFARDYRDNIRGNLVAPVGGAVTPNPPGVPSKQPAPLATLFKT